MKFDRQRFKIGNSALLVIGVLAILSISCKKSGENGPPESSMTDIEDNSYKIVKIGSQWWMAENLKTTKYNNGMPIQILKSNDEFGYLVTPAYCLYDNNMDNSYTYGAIYNWYAVNTGMLCPTGWHVPAETEWKTLINYLGGESVAGGKLKSTSSLWQFNNVGASNNSGFSALPGGARGYSDPGYYRGLGFNSIGVASGWWSNTEDSPQAKCYFLYDEYESVQPVSASKGTGLYIRCIADNIPTLRPPTLPDVTTNETIGVSGTTAISGGIIPNDGGASVTKRGVCWSKSVNPTIVLGTKTSDGTGRGSFTSSLTGLTVSTPYYIRAYATNSVGTVYGNQISFTTSSGQTGTVTDSEGNIYPTVTMGSQVWMTENLKATKYNDGTEIQIVTDNTAWGALSTPAYCWYNNDEASYKASFGALYNWYAVSVVGNGGKNLCPVNWHIPTDDDWSTLTTYWGGYQFAGGKLKETGKVHWKSPNEGATNESGFAALPGGSRSGGTFKYIGEYGFWWSATDLNSIYSISSYWTMSFINSVFGNSFVSKTEGVSVRCLRDQ